MGYPQAFARSGPPSPPPFPASLGLWYWLLGCNAFMSWGPTLPGCGEGRRLEVMPSSQSIFMW